MFSLRSFWLPFCALLLAIPSTAVAETPPDLSGAWVQKMVTTSSYRLARVARFTTVSTAYQKVDVEQRGERLQLTTEFCDIEMENTAPGVQPHLSQAFIDSLEPNTRPARIVANGDSWTVQIPKMWDVHGVRLDDPENDDLPEDGDDPRVFDQDGDGNPGFTLVLEGTLGGKMYLAQRIWDQMEGQLSDGNDQIEGPVQWDSEQSVLEASRRILRSSPTTDPDLERSNFEMVRLDEDLSCAQLLDRKESLFSR